MAFVSHLGGMRLAKRLAPGATMWPGAAADMVSECRQTGQLRGSLRAGENRYLRTSPGEEDAHGEVAGASAALQHVARGCHGPVPPPHVVELHV